MPTDLQWIIQLASAAGINVGSMFLIVYLLRRIAKLESDHVKTLKEYVALYQRVANIARARDETP